MKEQNKKPEYDVITLLKIGKKEYLESFQKEGLMYMNTSKYFRDSEKALQSCQKDKYEGYSELFQPDKVTLEINGKEIKDVSGPIRISHGFDDNRNIFCLYAILYDRKKKEMLNVDPRNCEFGDHFLLIKDVDKFLKKVVIACKDKKLKYGFVEYVDINKFHGSYGPFKKPKEYSYQNEFRILIENNDNGKPLRLKIGDISDISSIFKVSELKSIKLQIKDK